jgi:hypothetical protein
MLIYNPRSPKFMLSFMISLAIPTQSITFGILEILPDLLPLPAIKPVLFPILKSSISVPLINTTAPI